MPQKPFAITYSSAALVALALLVSTTPHAGEKMAREDLPYIYLNTPSTAKSPKGQFDPRMPPEAQQQEMPPEGMVNPDMPPRPDVPYSPSFPRTPTTTRTNKAKDSAISMVTGPKGEELYTLDYREADLQDIVRDISEITGKNFLLDQKVKGAITILSPSPIDKEAVWQVFLSALSVWNFTVVETNGLYKIVPTRDAASSPISTVVRDKDTPKSEGFITRLYTLDNVNANDMVNALKPMVSKNGDIKAYTQTNTLIITDSGVNIRRIIQIIQQLDKEGAKEQLEIIKLFYADPKDVVEKVRSIYQQQSNSPQDAFRRIPRPTAQGGVPGIANQSGEGPIAVSQVLADERTNSVIIVATEKAMDKIKDLVRQIDIEVKDPRGNIHVYYLQFANAEEIAATLSNLISGTTTPSSTGRTSSKKTSTSTRTPTFNPRTGIPNPSSFPSPISPTAGGGVVAEFSEGMRITADANTNSLVVTATTQEFETLKEVIKKLDIPRKQVFIETVIMELSIDKGRALGVSLAGGATPGGNPIFGATNFTNLNPLALDSASLAGLSGLSVAGISEETIAITLADGTTTSVPAFSAVLQALETSTTVNILSTPNILTTDNEEAEIIVGQNLPFVTESGRDSNNNPIIQVERQDVAITLRVTPHIKESDYVRLEVFQEITEVIPNQDATLVLNQGPSTTKRSATTAVMVKDLSTVVLGGLIADKSSVAESRVPWLGSIPVLGYFFKSVQRQNQKVNLLIFLTPFVIEKPEDFQQILIKKLQERTSFIKQNYGWIQRREIKASLKHHHEALLNLALEIDAQEKERLKAEKKNPALKKTKKEEAKKVSRGDQNLHRQEVNVDDLLETY